MKNIFFIISIALLSIACNDDDVAPTKETNDALVTRISRDGITSLELFYDVEKRLYRLNYYYLSNLTLYTLYEYDEDGLKESRRYNAEDHSLDYKSVFTLDNFGRVIKGENYSKSDFFDEVATINEFEYNSSGQLAARQFRSAGEPVNYRDEYTYDGDGSLIKQLRTYYPNQEDEYVGSLYEHTPASHLLPEFWKDYVLILDITSGGEGIRNMFVINSHYKNWNSAEVLSSESTYEMSDHEFDEEGNLTGQVITRKNVLNPQNPDEISVMTYDYNKGN